MCRNVAATLHPGRIPGVLRLASPPATCSTCTSPLDGSWAFPPDTLARHLPTVAIRAGDHPPGHARPSSSPCSSSTEAQHLLKRRPGRPAAADQTSPWNAEHRQVPAPGRAHRAATAPRDGRARIAHPAPRRAPSPPGARPQRTRRLPHPPIAPGRPAKSPCSMPPAVEALFQTARGLPRLINRIAHYALSAAATRQRPHRQP